MNVLLTLRPIWTSSTSLYVSQNCVVMMSPHRSTQFSLLGMSYFYFGSIVSRYGSMSPVCHWSNLMVTIISFFVCALIAPCKVT